MDQCDKQILLSGPALWPLANTETARLTLQGLYGDILQLTPKYKQLKEVFFKLTVSPPHMETP